MHADDEGRETLLTQKPKPADSGATKKRPARRGGRGRKKSSVDNETLPSAE